MRVSLLRTASFVLAVAASAGQASADNVAMGAIEPALLAAGAAESAQVLGDGDAFVETNEAWSLTVPLTNTGGVAAAAISGELTSSTPGITISTGAASYPDLEPTASGSNATPFTFIVTGAVPCGARVQFSLVVSFGGGVSPQTFAFSLRTGVPGTPVTFSFAGPAVPIPDGADLTGSAPGVPAIGSLPVAGLVGSVYDVDLRIDGATCSTTVGSASVGLDHSFVNDLELVLRSPSGTTALVIDNTDGSGNNFCQTLLDDESAGGSIQGVLIGAAPFTGSFRPNAPLADFYGEVPNGTWQLQAQDFFLSDTGNLRAFSVVVTPAVCDAPPLTTRIAATKTVAGAFSPGSAATYTVTLANTGGLGQADNPGAELTDVLPASLTLVSANASAGTAVADLGANTVTWDGALAGLGSATVTIVATINAAPGGTVVSNQGALSYDGDGNGTNEASSTTDDPAQGGANDPTTFVVVAGSFFTVAPCRVLDTRSSAPVAAGESLIVTVTGGPCGLPITATAVSLNATVTQGQSDGFVTLYPADEALPNTSTLNFSVGQTRANNTVVGLAPDGSLRILNGSASTVHVIVDVNGYFR